MLRGARSWVGLMVVAAIAVLAACAAAATSPGTRSRGHTARVAAAIRSRGHSATVGAATTSDPTPPPIRHVFIIVLENESASTSFGRGSPAPYLARTLVSEGAYLPHYHGTGHHSNDNYIAMISGQPPNPENQEDCMVFSNFAVPATAKYGAEKGDGCVYPAGVQTVAGQLDAHGYSWRDYDEDMGDTPSRESATCGHPGIDQPDRTQSAAAKDQYATRHDPFVYFHSIIDDKQLCDSHVVSLKLLPHDLARAARTPNYVFITPNLCHDGHDSPCADGEPGGLTSANAFLRRWVPRITRSPAFRAQNGLLIINFDESDASDTSSCCGEIAGPAARSPGIGGPGGGDTGAVLLSPCIKPGTVSKRAYNHYTMLRSVEDIFRLPHIGYAQLPGERAFGSDVYTRRCDAPPRVRLRVPRILRTHAGTAQIPVRFSSSTPGATFEVELRQAGHGAWRVLRRNTAAGRVTYRGHAPASYRFRVRATSGIGVTGAWASASVRVLRARLPGPTAQAS